MARLWALRHAKSRWDDPALHDHDRPLAPRGERDCARLRRHCASVPVLPELVLCSSARRARATLEALLPVLGDPEVLVEEGLYLASAHTLLTRLRTLDVESALLVGHDPGLQGLVVALAREGPLRDRVVTKLPTGALATLELPDWRDVGPASGELTAFVTPRDLR